MEEGEGGGGGHQYHQLAHYLDKSLGSGIIIMVKRVHLQLNLMGCVVSVEYLVPSRPRVFAMGACSDRRMQYN